MHSKTDKELLDSFVAAGDGTAFAELVARYSPMVYRACRRLLGNDHDAEDATQAAFVVLARKAGSLRQEGRLNGWLHRVARLVALEALRKRTDRERHQTESALWQENLAADLSEADRETVLRQVDTALNSLSAVLREAVVLRHLRGFSEQEAAAQAGCAVSAMKWRTSDGLAKLRQRLAKRGVTLSGVALAGLLTSEASAAVPETLLPSILATVKTAVATTATATTATSTAAMLAKGAMTAMFWHSVKTAAMVAVSVGVVGVGGVAAVHAVAEKEAPKPAAATALVTATNAQSTASALAFKVHPGDPLACAEAYRKAFRMLKALPDPLTTSWITNGPAEVIQQHIDVCLPVYEQMLIAAQYENVNWQWTSRVETDPDILDREIKSVIYLAKLSLIIGRYRLEHGDVNGLNAWYGAWLMGRHASQGGIVGGLVNVTIRSIMMSQLKAAKLRVPAPAFVPFAMTLASLPDAGSFEEILKGEKEDADASFERLRQGNAKAIEDWDTMVERIEKSIPGIYPRLGDKTPEARMDLVKRMAEERTVYYDHLLPIAAQIAALPMSNQVHAINSYQAKASAWSPFIREIKVAEDQVQKQACFGTACRPLLIAVCRAAATPEGAPLPEVTNPLTGKPIEVKRIPGGVEGIVESPWPESAKPLHLRLVFGE
jgi:RNA polymerase sigma factor (sigma-70 family)